MSFIRETECCNNVFMHCTRVNDASMQCVSLYLYVTIGIKHGFSCINIRQVPWQVLKTEAECRGFQHLPRDLANVNALKNHVRLLLLHKKLKTFATFRVISCTILFRLFTDVSHT